MSTKKDLKGKTFGRLSVIEEDGRIGTNVAWKCRCSCGNIVRVRANSLLSGNTSSCGCGRIDAITIHNGTHTHLFDVWRTMKERCLNKTYKGFPNYGGRGITVCDEWLDFENFRTWANSNGYREDAGRGKCTLDRIDVNGNYEPSNCRWVDAKTQARNRRNTVFIEYGGARRSMAEWAEVLGVKFNTLYWRYSEGWSPREILYGRV